MTDNNSKPTIPDSALPLTSANFESRKFQHLNDDTLRIKPTIASLLFSLFFVLSGLGIAILWAASNFTELEGPHSFPLLLIGLMIAAGGIWTYHSSNEQLLVNRETGASFLRSWHPTLPLDTTTLYKHVKPEDIVAIQTISRTVKRRSNRSKRLNSHIEFQVNLCTSDGERHNAFVTKNAEKADELGNKLSQMFGVPLVVNRHSG